MSGQHGDRLSLATVLNRLEGRWLLILLTVASVLGVIGQVPKADNVTHRVLDLVSNVQWADFHKPFLMPFPIDAMAFRPISVLIFKSHVELFGLGHPPIVVAFIKSFLSAGLFGLAARSWLRAAGFSKYATLSAVLSMVCGPALFQVWYYPELDLLGAAATLWVGSCLLQDSKLSLWRWVGITLAVAFSMLLKEASALVQLAFLGGVAIALWETNPKLRNRHLLVAAVSASAWGVLVLPLLAGPDTTVGALPILQRISVVEHNFAQAVYLLSPAGVLLLLFGALAKAPFNNRDWRAISNLPTLGIAGLIAMPLISFYSHYEAVYYSPRWFGLMFGVMFALGLAVSAITRRREESARIATYTVVAGFVGMSFVGLIAPTAREDLAARIFIGFAPIMFALALTGLDLTKAVVTLRKNRLASIGRYSCTALLITLIWHPIASGINYTTDYRARHIVDLQGKETLSQFDVGEGLVLFNHYVEWLDPLGIMAAGGDISVRDWDFLQVPAWLIEDDYPKARWIYPDFLDFEKYTADRDVWLYWLSAKSLMTEGANEALIGQLSWTRKDFGLFTPVVGDGHNRPEDHRFSIYRTEESPLESRFSDADTEWAASQRFITVPMIATDIFRRAITRVPIIEQYEYRGSIFKQ